MKISQRERKLLFVLSFLFWLWAIKGTVSLYNSLRETKKALERVARPATAQVTPQTERNLLLDQILALETGGLPWPESKAGVNMLAYLRRKAQEAGLSVKLMSLEALEKIGSHKRLPLQLELTGTAAGFVTFLYSLEQDNFICNVSGLALESQEEQLRGRVGLEFFLLDQKALARSKQELLALGAKPTLRKETQPLSYYFPQGLERAFLLPQPKLPEIVAPEHLPQPPAQIPKQEEPQGRPEPVEPYHPSYLLTGIVYQEGKPMAVLQGPLGQTMLVAEGADLEGQRVVKITRDGVLFKRGGQEAWLKVAP